MSDDSNNKIPDTEERSGGKCQTCFQQCCYGFGVVIFCSGFTPIIEKPTPQKKEINFYIQPIIYNQILKRGYKK